MKTSPAIATMATSPRRNPWISNGAARATFPSRAHASTSSAHPTIARATHAEREQEKSTRHDRDFQKLHECRGVLVVARDRLSDDAQFRRDGVLPARDPGAASRRLIMVIDEHDASGSSELDCLTME